MMRTILLMFCLGLSLVPAAMAKQPNFLILLADDISASSLGCYGGENPNTSPHIDKLADEAVRFTNMFVTQAVCGPARAELYTGPGSRIGTAVWRTTRRRRKAR